MQAQGQLTWHACCYVPQPPRLILTACVTAFATSTQCYVSIVCGIAGMRAIDLTCLLLAPIATGFLMTYTSPLTAVLAIAAWNMAAWAPECYLLLCARNASAALGLQVGTHEC